MTVKRMTCRAYTKSVDVAARTVEQIVSVFGNVDYAGDRVNLGSFAKSLDRWAASGDPIPAIWAHTWDDPFAHIGAVLEARELSPGDPILPDEIKQLGGLYTKYRVDGPDRPFADQVFHLLNERRVREASFAYDVIREKRASDGANDLLELDLIEIGPCLKGMNPMTQLLDAKSLAADIASKVSAATTPAEIDAVLAALGVKTMWQSHTFLPKDDDASRCSICDLTRATVGHLNLLSGEPDGAKAWVFLDGCVEVMQQEFYEDALEWVQETPGLANGGLYCLYLEATFPDEMRAVVLVEGWDDPPGDGRYFELTFKPDTDGDDPDGYDVDTWREIEVQGVVAPKARRKGITIRDASPLKVMKGGTFRENGDDTANADGKAKDPATGKAHDPKGTSGSASGTGAPSRALVELDALDIS